MGLSTRQGRTGGAAAVAAAPELGHAARPTLSPRRVCGSPHGQCGPQTGGQLPSRPSRTSSASRSVQLLTGTALPPLRRTIKKNPSLQLNCSTWVSVGRAMFWEADTVPPGLGAEASTTEPGRACIRPVATHTLVQEEPVSKNCHHPHTWSHLRHG